MQPLSEEEEERLAKEAAERKAEEEEEEKKALKAASRLAVIFVIAPDVQEDKPRKLAERVEKLCEKANVRCGIVPSPDVLVAALANYANEIAGRKVTDLDDPVYAPAAPEETFLLPRAEQHLK